jgi:hypothetical protein
MYPTRELIRLGVHKRMLQRRITRRREECVAAAICIARPVAWLDRALASWRQLSPWIKLAAVPLGFLGKRSGPSRPLSALLRWLPIISSVMRGLRAVRHR